jgi:glycosyltransferase 2 family protein
LLLLLSCFVEYFLPDVRSASDDASLEFDTRCAAIQTAFLLLSAQLAAYCGLGVSLRVWLFAWPLAKVAAILPLTQGGIGVREAALVALLAPFGAPGPLVLAAGVIWEAVVIAGGLLAGAVALALNRSQVPAERPAL